MNTQRKLSNIERGKWRTKCREILAQHIEARLGLNLDPSQVRLHTTRDDGYCWKALPEAQRLFSKNLSDHSIGAYKELCDNVGVTFEAVPAVLSSPQNRLGHSIFSALHPEPRSFTSQVSELQAQNDTVSEQLFAVKSHYSF
ncbi:hypothetical protein F5Y16DRAFT_396346 [Xylariaceae sp. FL0255]|nr:hypothetical protein F5Y16DRAFT_396346 [Xylariaceae sp. FL0255]